MTTETAELDQDLLVKCPAKLGDSACASPVFYDWGIELLDRRNGPDLRGGEVERFKDWATSNRVKICIVCSTPYVLQAGELIDISEVLSAEAVKQVIARGQVSNPHPNIKDP